jgi:hypothetical protein
MAARPGLNPGKGKDFYFSHQLQTGYEVHVLPWCRCQEFVELHINSPVRLQGVVLNEENLYKRVRYVTILVS